MQIAMEKSWKNIRICTVYTTGCFVIATLPSLTLPQKTHRTLGKFHPNYYESQIKNNRTNFCLFVISCVVFRNSMYSLHFLFAVFCLISLNKCIFAVFYLSTNLLFRWFTIKLSYQTVPVQILNWFQKPLYRHLSSAIIFRSIISMWMTNIRRQTMTTTKTIC